MYNEEEGKEKMPIIIQERFKKTNKEKNKVGGGGMDIAKTKKKKKACA